MSEILQEKPTMNTTAKFVFSFSKMENSTRYIRATYAKEKGRSLLGVSIVIAVFLMMLTVELISGDIFGGSWAGQQVLNRLRAPVLVLLLVSWPSVLVFHTLLFFVRSKWAWEKRFLGKWIIKTGKKYSNMWDADLFVYRYQGKRTISQNAYYFDERLGDFAINKEPAKARLFDDKIMVFERKQWIEYAYADIYKTFWGADLVVLRTKTEGGPRDILLDTEGWSKEELKALNKFLFSKLPKRCKRYHYGIFMLTPWAFRKAPIYDMWEGRCAGFGEVVSFLTMDQMMDG